MGFNVRDDLLAYWNFEAVPALPYKPQPGEHFWAEMDGKLVVMICTETEGRFNVCGEWECSIQPGDFTPLQLIPRPAGDCRPLYYT